VAKSKIVMIATGGTGGHIFPALALKEVLIKQNFKVIMLVDKRYQSFASIDGQDTFIIDSAGSGGKILSIFKKSLAIIKGVIKSFFLIQKYKPSVIIGFGGYPSFPPCIAAYLLKVPFIIHEQNSVLGKANRILAFFARYIATSFIETLGIKPEYSVKIKYTGNPVRGHIKNITTHKNNSEKLIIFIFGGSLGASVFSEIIPSAISELDFETKNKIEIIQQVRKNDIADVDLFYRKHNVKAQIADFFDNMDYIYSQTDLIICRAGATTIAELLYIQKPAILVPIPNSINDHQRINANFLKNNDCCVMLEENKDFNSANLKLCLEQLINDKEFRERMSSSYKKIAKVDGVSKLIELINNILL